MKYLIKNIESGKKVWVVYRNLYNSNISPEFVTIGDYIKNTETLMPRREVVFENGTGKIPGGLFVNEFCFDTKEECENEITCILKKQEETNNCRREFYRGAARGFMFRTKVHFDNKEKEESYIQGFIDGCMMLHNEREKNNFIYGTN